MTEGKIIIYCDGACAGNQFNKNTGSWGAVLKYKNKTKEIFGGEKDTTNQRMELISCIKALEQIKTNNHGIEVHSDSAYLINCMNQKWYEKWQTNGWKNSSKKPVENKDLWLRLLALISKYHVSFHKVAGHSGNHLNEVADQLAQKGVAG